jgi:hypothetical protein
MSTLMSPLKAGARARVPRFAEAAVERARLTVVPQRSLGRTQAARTPFAVLVLSMLVAGVVGLLMFNTHMQQASFKATALQQQVSELTAEEQALNMELDGLRDPQRLAASAKELGMVPPSQPAFVRLADGRILGNPTAATSADAVRINPLPPLKPAALAPAPIIVKVPAPLVPAATAAAPSTGTTPADTGTASGEQRSSSGRKKADDQPQSGGRVEP